MPYDPGAKRVGPAPAHPRGYPASEDAPVHLAPALDVRPSARQVSEEVRARFSMSGHGPDSAATVSTLPQTSGISEGKLVISVGNVAERRAATKNSWPAAGSEPGASPEASEREALERELRALPPVDDRPDRDLDRPAAARSTLGRARAIRFMLTLDDVWDAATPSREHAIAFALRPFHFEASFEVALMVVLSDGAALSSARSAYGRDFPSLRAIVERLREHRTELTREQVREHGAAAVARLTVIGWRCALDRVHQFPATVGVEARGVALGLAAGVALSPALNDHRLGALGDLERALALPHGAATRAIEEARRSI